MIFIKKPNENINMTMKTVVILAASMMLSAWAAEEHPFTGGTCAREKNGACAITVGEHRIEAASRWIDTRWGTPVIDGAMKASVTNGALRLEFSAVPPDLSKLNKDHPMMVKLTGDATSYPKGRLMLGPAAKTFEQPCWAYGDSIKIQPMNLAIKMSAGMSINYLIGKDGKWQMRLFFPAKETDAGRCFEGSLTFTCEPVKIELASDILDQKRVQYGRVLMPPQEKGFDPKLWREAINATNVTQKVFGLVEDLFDARSRLYTAAERLSYKPTEDVEGAALVAEGYAALNRMDHTAATNACARLEARLVGSEKWMPYGVFNPFNWVKCFTQWGYKRAKDGCSVSEPNPWLLQWEDGFRFSLAQDERVSIAHGNGGNADFFTTRYLKPMDDVSFERTWVDTKWNLPDKRITFSMLTPVVRVEDVDTLRLSGFSSEPRRFRIVNDHGQLTGPQIVHWEEEPAEVIPSVLMDFTAPPPPPKAYSAGEQKIDAEKLVGPYICISGIGWSLACFPTARPVSVCWQKGVLTIRFDRKGEVGVMRLMNNLHPPEHPEVCEFFARTFLAYPTSCRSTVENGVARWKYGYRYATNAWGTERHVIAPVPPLVAYAEIPVPGSRGYKYPQKWGLFRYCEGTEVSCTLPADLPREPRLRGVNVSLNDTDEKWEEHITNGAHWVRAYFSGNHDLAEHCAKLEDRLRKFGHRVKFLVDPHCKEYRVRWDTGMDPDPAVENKFYALWDAISKVGAGYPHAIEGYDLYNEPGATAGSEERWRGINEKATAIIRANHSGAKVYYSAVYGGNPNGLFNLTPLRKECDPQVITYHFYSPHAFSHQKSSTHNRGNDTCVFYPGWSAPIDWKAGNHFGGTTVDWYDRWTLAAILLPAYEHYAEHRKPLHVGEFGIIGYANGKSPWSACLWTRDAVELMEANGASWHIWNGGFGLGNRFTRAYIYDLWKSEER